MDGISLLDVILFYSLILVPFLTMVLLLFWMSANIKNTAKARLYGTYHDFFHKGQLSFILLIFALQVSYYTLFFILLSLEYTLAFTLLCIIPILSMILLYSWTFGSKNTSKGRIFIISVFIVQVVFAILNIVLFSITATSNL